MRGKGREFKGLIGGGNYRRIAALFGIKREFYRMGLGDVVLEEGMKAIDLGCGPGALSFALAEKSHPDAEIIGVDISDDQLSYARKHSSRFSCMLKFEKISMDELPFQDGCFDLVMTSMALHETPPDVRRCALDEAARVLKDEGRLLLVDWSKPRFGLWGVLWYPFCRWGENNKDNWNNTYPELCRRRGFVLEEDRYLNSIARRQVFRRKRRS